MREGIRGDTPASVGLTLAALNGLALDTSSIH